MTFVKIVRKLNFLVRGVTSSLLFKYVLKRRFKTSDALLVFGFSRSGSTWLAEIMSSLPGHSQIFEPLNTAYIKEAVKAGVQKNMSLKKEQRWDDGREFLDKVFSGRLINPWLASQIFIKDVLKTKQLVIKFVRGNLLIGWVCQNFSIKPPALVIRHPCAIVSSHLQKNWTPSKEVLLSNPYFKEFPEIYERCQAIKEPEELNALAWCLHYHAPLSLPKPYPFVLICYEKLVIDGAKELTPLFDAWDLTLTDEISNLLNKPSNTVTETSQVLKGSGVLSGWQRKLTDEQVSNIIGVLQMFEMDFYTDALEADYEKLFDFSK